MTPELLAMLGGGVSGFVMKMIAAQADNQARLFERMIARQYRTAYHSTTQS